MNNTFNFSNNNNSPDKPQITYFYETNPNTNTIQNLNDSPKNNISQLNQPQKPYDLNLNSYSNKIDKYKLQIIEKDNLLIDLKRKEKDLNKEIAKLKLSLSSKDDEIFKLEDKIQELLHSLKNTENQNEKNILNSQKQQKIILIK